MKARSLLLFLFLAGATFFHSSCELLDIFDPDFGNDPGDGNDNSPVAVLKGLILEAAENARGDCDGDDNLEPVRASINELVEQLVDLVPERTEAEKLEQVTGAWRQVWSDASLTDLPGVCIEAEHMYQVVSPEGYYYNISQARLLGLEFMSYIRGTYTVEENFLATEVANNFFSGDIPAPGTDLERLARRAEDGRISRARFVPPLPINGDTGRMANVYVDDDLRIVTDGRPVGESEVLFVMRRAEEVGR